MKNYITKKDITKIYNISQQIVDEILIKYKIDTFKSKKWIFINLKDFHKVYTSTYNPSLFGYVKRKNTDSQEYLIFWDIENSFLNIFSKPYRLTN
jgi:hypothetical protein